MPRSRRQVGTDLGWAAIHETTNGRDLLCFRLEDQAVAALRKRELSPLGGHTSPIWLALGGVVLDPSGAFTEHRWGEEFDPDGPPRYTTLVPNGDHPVDCRSCGLTIGRGQPQVGGVCAPCEYRLRPRPVQIAETPYRTSRLEDAKESLRAVKEREAQMKPKSRYGHLRPGGGRKA